MDFSEKINPKLIVLLSCEFLINILSHNLFIT
jgi:hypothetical protein